MTALAIAWIAICLLIGVSNRDVLKTILVLVWLTMAIGVAWSIIRALLSLFF